MRYREIEVSGEPREIGRQIGDAAGEEIRGFAEAALQRVNQTVRISPQRAAAIASDCCGFVDQYAPHLLAELRGMSESSGVSLEDLMILQVRNQFTDEPAGGCTSFSLAASAVVEGRNLVGQNWDNDPALDPFTIVLTRRPASAPALTTVTQAGLIAYIGFNSEGLGACLNTLPAPSRPTGVPHYFTLRGIYESRSLDEAVAAVRRAQRAIPANIMLATPQGPADLEITIDDVHLLRDPSGQRVTHTNHCLHPDLTPINGEFPELIESGPRKQRIDRLTGGPVLGLDQLKDVLRDHEGHPRSICRHANDHPEHGFWVTVFSVIIDPKARQMHLTRGNPCEHPYETYSMN